MAVPNRISLVTLGVEDLERSTTFYRALGWQEAAASVPGEVTFFALHGAHLALFPLLHLAAETGLPRAGRATSSSTHAINCDAPADVDAAFATIESVGGTIVQPPRKMDWGGYAGYFADPDGHLWEVTHNPGWPIGSDGRPQLH